MDLPGDDDGNNEPGQRRPARTRAHTINIPAGMSWDGSPAIRLEVPQSFPFTEDPGRELVLYVDEDELRRSNGIVRVPADPAGVGRPGGSSQFLAAGQNAFATHPSLSSITLDPVLLLEDDDDDDLLRKQRKPNQKRWLPCLSITVFVIITAFVLSLFPVLGGKLLQLLLGREGSEATATTGPRPTTMPPSTLDIRLAMNQMSHDLTDFAHALSAVVSSTGLDKYPPFPDEAEDDVEADGKPESGTESTFPTRKKRPKAVGGETSTQKKPTRLATGSVPRGLYEKWTHFLLVDMGRAREEACFSILMDWHPYYLNGGNDTERIVDMETKFGLSLDEIQEAFLAYVFEETGAAPDDGDGILEEMRFTNQVYHLCTAARNLTAGDFEAPVNEGFGVPGYVTAGWSQDMPFPLFDPEFMWRINEFMQTLYSFGMFEEPRRLLETALKVANWSNTAGQVHRLSANDDGGNEGWGWGWGSWACLMSRAQSKVSSSWTTWPPTAAQNSSNSSTDEDEDEDEDDDDMPAWLSGRDPNVYILQLAYYTADMIDKALSLASPDLHPTRPRRRREGYSRLYNSLILHNIADDAAQMVDIGRAMEGIDRMLLGLLDAWAAGGRVVQSYATKEHLGKGDVDLHFLWYGWSQWQIRNNSERRESHDGGGSTGASQGGKGRGEGGPQEGPPIIGGVRRGRNKGKDHRIMVEQAEGRRRDLRMTTGLLRELGEWYYHDYLDEMGVLRENVLKAIAAATKGKESTRIVLKLIERVFPEGPHMPGSSYELVDEAAGFYMTETAVELVRLLYSMQDTATSVKYAFRLWWDRVGTSEV